VLDSLELESDGKEIHLEILSKQLRWAFVLRGSSNPHKSEEGEIKVQISKDRYHPSDFSAFEKPMLIFGFVGLLTIGVASWLECTSLT